MPALPGRRVRRLDHATVVIQTRARPETRAKAHATAAALNVSLSAYLERLIEHDELDSDGRPLWWTDDENSPQEELPLAEPA